MKKILKAYRFFLLFLFVISIIIGSFLLYHFYNFIQPVKYTVQTIRNVTEAGELEVSVSSNFQEPIGVTLISPSGREYTQSSRDIQMKENGSTRTLTILTADIGEWKIRYRNTRQIKVSVSSNFNKSNAAILVSTKATKYEKNKNKIILSMEMSKPSYSYTIKAVRRNDGMTLTLQDKSKNKTTTLKPYEYSGVWDFYLNTKHGKETYSTMFSYTF